MTVNAVQGNYVYITDPSTGETYQLTQDEAASLFGTDDYLGAEDAYATKTVDISMVSVDGKNDGKIETDEKVKSGFKAVADMVLSPITEAAKGNFIPALVAGAGLAIGILTFPIGTIAMGAIGVAGGIATFAKGASAADGATTDAEARQAYGTMAQGLYTAGMSAGVMAKGVQVQKSNPNSNMYGTKGFKDTTKGYFKDLGQSIGNGARNIGSRLPHIKTKTSTGSSGVQAGSDLYYDNGKVYRIETASNGTEILTEIDPQTAPTGTGSGNGSVIYGQDNHSGQLLLEQKTTPIVTPEEAAIMQYQEQVAGFSLYT